MLEIDMTLTPTQRRLQEEHIARQLRFALAAATHQKVGKPPQSAQNKHPELVVAGTSVGQISSVNEVVQEEAVQTPSELVDADGPQAKSKRISIDDIQYAVAFDCNVTRADVLLKRQTSQIVHARQIGMYLAKKLRRFSLPYIGKRFGNKDHTTVTNAVRKVAWLVGDKEELVPRSEVLRKKGIDEALVAQIERIKCQLLWEQRPPL